MSKAWFSIYKIGVFGILIQFNGIRSQSLSSDGLESKSLTIDTWSGFRGWSLRGQVCHEFTRSHIPHNCSVAPRVNRHWRIKGELPPDDILPGEGMTLSIINQRQGYLMLRKVFPLRYYWAHWADLDWHMRRISSGRIVVMAISYSGSGGIRQATKQLTDLGSLLAEHLTPSAHWTWVFVKGGRTISETAVIRGVSDTYASAIISLSQHQPLYNTITDPLENDRWRYCEQVEGMGPLCDELEPAPLSMATPRALIDTTEDDFLKEIPVIITAGRRHRYIYHSLTTVLSATGAKPENLLVVLGDSPRATTELLNLLDVQYTVLPTEGQGNTKLFHYYQGVYKLIAEKYPKAKAVIILDEDVEVSPDFFSFMSQTIGILLRDPTLYCVNGYGRPQALSHDVGKVFRADAQVSWGYAITLNFVREALTYWEKIPRDVGTTYDYWLYENVAKGRECLFPEVSRTRHYGIGLNTNAYNKEKYFLEVPLAEKAGIALKNIDRLLLPFWKEDLTAEIKGATPIRGNPCAKSFLTETSKSITYVFYVKMPHGNNGMPDITDYFVVANCLGAWGFSPQGLHNGVATFTVYPKVTLLVVGVPYSPFTRLRRSGFEPWTMTGISDLEKQIVQEGFGARNHIHVANTNLTSDMLMEKLSIRS